MAPWQYKSMLCLQASSCHLESEREWAIISNPRSEKKPEVHSKTRKKAKVWRLAKKYLEQGIINLNVLTDGKKLDQLKWESTQDYPSTLCLCKFSNYTEWCVMVQTVCSSLDVLKEQSWTLFCHLWWLMCSWWGHIKNACARQTNLPANWWDPRG